MGQLIKTFLSSPLGLAALSFLVVYFGVRNSKILGGSSPPKVKLDQKTGTLVPDDTWRKQLALVLALTALIGVPVLLRIGLATISLIAWFFAVIFGAILVDQGFAKYREEVAPKMKKLWEDLKHKTINKGRKS